MRTRSFAIVLLLGASGCVVSIGDLDDDVGDASDESGATDESESGTSDETGSGTEAESTATDATTDVDTDSDSTDTGMPADCEDVGDSNLPGVCIWFPTPGESWTLDEVAQGIAIPYHVIVEADVPEVVAMPQDAGWCDLPDESGLIVFARLGAGDQLYCLCDIGLCPGRPLPPMTLPAGDTPLEFEWNGRNWTGPSDTDNPYGPPFPAGEYTLELSAIGTAGGVEFAVSNTFTVTLTEGP